jgi:hypothetical protein
VAGILLKFYPLEPIGEPEGLLQEEQYVPDEHQEEPACSPLVIVFIILLLSSL